MPITAVWLPFALLASSQSAPPVDNILKEVREAVHYNQWMSQSKGIRLSGTSHENGVDAIYSLQFDRAGRWVQKTESFLGTSEGCDGRVQWAMDWSGVPHEMAFSSRDDSKLTLLVFSGQWLDNLSSGVALDGAGIGPDGYTLNVSLKENGASIKVVVSKTTWLPVKTIRGGLSGDVVTDYSDWRIVSSLRVPFQTKISSNGMVQSMKIEKGESIDSESARPYGKPKTNKESTSYTKGGAKLECLRVKTGHMMVRPKINGKDMGWFIFDSGAGAMVINKSTADELKLETIGKTQVVGMGGTGEAAFRKVSEFSLGEVTMKDSPFLELDLDQIAKILGIKLGGIVGRDLFYKSIVEIDGPGSQINVYNPEAYLLKGTWSRVKIDRGMPAIEASFDRGQGWFGVDSGGDEVVLFHAPAVERLDLLRGRTLTDSQVGGYGGMTKIKVGPIDWFKIGNATLDKPRATFAISKTGVLSNQYLTGDIGQALLKQFLVVFDLSHEQMAFIKP